MDETAVRFLFHMFKFYPHPGPAEFISEYVEARSIPIPRLLEALGVSLVIFVTFFLRIDL
jgi:hypothetical protein